VCRLTLSAFGFFSLPFALAFCLQRAARSIGFWFFLVAFLACRLTAFPHAASLPFDSFNFSLRLPFTVSGN
jgi:hypothetical protein